MNHTIIYSNEKIISNTSEISYLHAETHPNETKLDMIKREGLEHVHFIFDDHLTPFKVHNLIESTPKPSPTKYKVGDKVTIVNNKGGAPDYTVGMVGRVGSIISPGNYEVWLYDNGCEFICSYGDNELELVE